MITIRRGVGGKQEQRRPFLSDLDAFHVAHRSLGCVAFKIKSCSIVRLIEFWPGPNDFVQSAACQLTKQLFFRPVGKNKQPSGPYLHLAELAIK